MAQHNTQKKRHQHRDDLIGEHAAGDAGQMFLAFLFTAIWILDTFFLKYTIFLNHYVPIVVKIPIGVVLLILSGYLAKKGLSIVFGEKKEKPCVIRKGVFNITRHPIYLSEILFYLGLLMLSISLAAALVWIIAILFLHHISRYEERQLLAHFGEEYEQYIQDVPMWIPRLRKKRSESPDK